MVVGNQCSVKKNSSPILDCCGVSDGVSDDVWFVAVGIKR